MPRIIYRFTLREFVLDACGGLYWTRTSDPVDVNDVLYQLSQQTKNFTQNVTARKLNRRRTSHAMHACAARFA